MGFVDVFIPFLNRTVRLVDREQLRFKLHGRTLRLPGHLKGISAPPPPPLTFDWSHGEKIVFPILGNDVEGDCYMADALHLIQLWTGQWGPQAAFNTSDALKRYEALSGGDNGLSDDDIFPAWRTGLLPVNGPYKILDEMTVDPRDDAAIGLAMYYFCGASYTMSLPSGWDNIAGPGAIWDKGGGRSVGGHAVSLTGRNSKGYYDLRTWGISPPIQLTPAGLKSADPEVVVCFSRDMFDPSTGLSPAGLSWDDSRALWKSLGGKDVGPSPFAPPVVPIPIPKEPYRIVLGSDLPGGQLSITVGGLVVKGASSSPFTAGEYLVTHADPAPPQ